MVAATYTFLHPLHAPAVQHDRALLLRAPAGGTHWVPRFRDPVPAGRRVGSGALLRVPVDYGPMAIVGASGAVFGVLYGFAHFGRTSGSTLGRSCPSPHGSWCSGSPRCRSTPGFTGAGAGVAHFAHLGGFVGGWRYLSCGNGDRRRSSAGRPAQRLPPWIALRQGGPRGEAVDDIRVEALHEINRHEVERIRAKIDEHGQNEPHRGRAGFHESWRPASSGSASRRHPLPRRSCGAGTAGPARGAPGPRSPATEPGRCGTARSGAPLRPDGGTAR